MSKKPTVAVVATVNRPGPSFDTWLQYHLQCVDTILLFIDDPQKLNLFAYPEDERIVCFEGSQIKADAAGMHRLMWRQQQNTDAALAYCLDKGITWLLSLDDDELLFENGAVDWRTWDIAQISFRNLEVLQSVRSLDNYYLEIEHVFKMSIPYVQHSGYQFLNYVHGKCAVRVRRGIKAPWHVHSFDIPEGRSIQLEGPYLLHYPAVTYDRWESKYRNLGRFSDFWCEDESMPIENFDRLYLQTRDVIAEAEKTDDWGTARAFYYGLFPHRPHEVAQLMQRGLLCRFDPFAGTGIRARSAVPSV